MENATKALLIAAAVLIAILLIAFGMRIMNSTTETTGQAEAVGEQMTQQTTQAGQSALDALKGLDIATSAT